MIIDLHTHTHPTSACSRMPVGALLEAAAARGLDAVCVTDHSSISGGLDAQTAAACGGMTVFRGVEARTTLGDILVFGVDEDFPEGVDGGHLLAYVALHGGASVLAHPFRRGGGWALWYWLDRQGLALDAGLAGRPEFAHLHAVETFNGQVSAGELAQAEVLARILGLPAVGGSDAHAAHQVGTTGTEFVRPVGNEAELAAEIRAGRVRPWRRP